ncbi:MAG: sodium/solute symporter [Clostridiales bacterium]|nr:sodium/solute symporter [Clostridiales bacterium]
MKYLLLAVYAAMLVVIALYTAKRNKTLNDFFLGGRNMGAWMSAFAYGTSYFSAVIFIGYAGKIGWGFGLAAVWIGIGNALIGSLLAWLVLGKRTRVITHRLNVATMPDFFEKRFNSRGLKILSAIIIFLFLVPYSASVYQGLSYLFEEVFNIPFLYCILGMAILTGVYLVIGGYLATAISDFVQGTIMLIGIVMVIFFVVRSPEVGGLSEGLSRLAQIDGKLVSASGPPGWAQLLSLVFLTSLGSWGLPQMLHKFYAIRDEQAIRRGTVISTLFAIAVAGGAYFIGVFGRLFLSGVPVDPATGAANFDMIMPQVLATALNNVDALIGIVVVLVLSASMSTLSSLVLVSSSAISMDLVSGIMMPGMGEKKVHALMRILCGVFVVLSVMLAVFKLSTIVTLMSLSWGTISGAFLGPFVWGLYMKRATRAGAWAGMLAGLGTSIALNLFAPEMGAPMAGCFAMAASLVVTPLVSLVTKPLPAITVKPVLEKVS